MTSIYIQEHLLWWHASIFFVAATDISIACLPCFQDLNHQQMSCIYFRFLPYLHTRCPLLLSLLSTPKLDLWLCWRYHCHKSSQIACDSSGSAWFVRVRVVKESAASAKYCQLSSVSGGVDNCLCSCASARLDASRTHWQLTTDTCQALTHTSHLHVDTAGVSECACVLWIGEQSELKVISSRKSKFFLVQNILKFKKLLFLILKISINKLNGNLKILSPKTIS